MSASTRRGVALRELYEEHNTTRGPGFVYGGQQRVAALRELAADSLSGARTIIDLGCRDGALTEALGAPSGSTVGIDIDRRALRRALEYRRLLPCAADLWCRSLPLCDNSADVVVACEILEHVPFPEHLLDEAARILRPGGVLLGSVPNAFRFKNRIAFAAGRPFEHDPTHLRQFSYRAIFALLSSRFLDVQIRPCVGRFVSVAPRLMANDLAWAARRPRS